EETLFATLNNAQAALCPGPWADGQALSANAPAFFEMTPEIGLRLLGRMIAFAGQQGGAELAQLEILYSEWLRSYSKAIAWSSDFRPLRRNVAGALVTLSKSRLLVEREPPRRIVRKPRKSQRKARFTTDG